MMGQTIASVRRRCVVAALLLTSSCSFAVRAGKGPGEVRKTHEYADAALMAVAAGGCMLAAIAWAAPEAYAEKDFYTNEPLWTPQERANVIATGQTWTPIACTLAAAFLASGIYGHAVAPSDYSGGGGGAGWAPVAAAFANGFIGAGQYAPTYAPTYATTPSPSTYQAPACSSDFNCSYGQVCVKATYATSGTCMQAVNSYGVPTYQPPSTNSIGPKMTPSCMSMVDCPVGFGCERGSCVKR